MTSKWKDKEKGKTFSKTYCMTFSIINKNQGIFNPCVLFVKKCSSFCKTCKTDNSMVNYIKFQDKAEQKS